MRYVQRFALGLALLVVLLAGGGATYQSCASAHEMREHPAPGRLVDVGGRREHLHCEGTGPVTVVLESGLGGTSLDWCLVKPAIAKMTRVCTRDRAGMGWSDPGPNPRSAGRFADELHEVLERAEVPKPYLLVGHSLGGHVVRIFAARHPEEVHGIVLVDASHEDRDARLPDSLRAKAVERLHAIDRMRTLAPFGVVRLMTPTDERFPPELRATGYALDAQTKTLQTIYEELAAFPLSNDEARAAKAPSSLPAVVLTAGGKGPPSTGDAAERDRQWQELQKDLASRFTRCQHTVVPDSSHYVQLDQPSAVIGAIEGLVGGAHDEAR